MLKIESCLKIWIIISKMLFEIAALACIALVLGVSTSVGIGSSTLINILLVIGFNYTVKESIAMTYIFLMGGGLATSIASARKRTIKGKRVIDYDLVMLTLPMLVSGTIFGTLLSHFLSEAILTIIFILLIFYILRTTYRQIQQQREQSNVIEMSNMKQQLLDFRQDFTAKNRLQEILDEQNKLFPLEKVKIVIHIYIYTIVLLLAKGGIGFESIIGLQPCHIGSWICLILHFILSYLYSKSIAIKKFQIDLEKESLGYVFQDSRQKMSYNKMREAMFNGFFGGTLGGCLALSVGLVLIPLWLRAGIDRRTVTNSTAPLIFSCSSISFFISVLLGSYDSVLIFLLFFSISILGSFYIKNLFLHFQEKYQSNKFQFSILMLLILASICVYLPKQYQKYKSNPLEFQQLHIFC